MERRRGVIGPLILIAIGVLFLLMNAGYLPGTFWIVAARLWPVILILVGIEVLLGRTRWGQLAVLVIGILVLAGVILLAQNPTLLGRGPAAQTATIARAASGVRSAELELNSGLGHLDLHSLAPGGANWIEGTVQYPSSLELVETYDASGDRARYKLDLRGTPMVMPTFGDAQWQLGLTPGMPLDLKVDTGVGDSEIDLTGVRAQTVNVHAGVGTVDITLPGPAGTVNATVNGGVGQLRVTIPAGVPARLHTKSGLGGLDIDGTRFPQVGEGTYETSDYGTATDRIELELDAGIGGVQVR